ncbi:hypothetical protein KC19_12G038100 [Ceratodon purpureus]|uniref:Uncharacterized protein n=1 Tax=Ceratodon purpureus TaxID=3225 RepID=A0A8T0G7B8_CERPU|nr:hypothetical protein KC19_12G038100 [Ceratodon purpureus]
MGTRREPPSRTSSRTSEKERNTMPEECRPVEPVIFAFGFHSEEAQGERKRERGCFGAHRLRIIHYRLVKKAEARDSSNDGEDIHFCRYGGSDIRRNHKWRSRVPVDGRASREQD